MQKHELLLAYYGDDFTGSTDALEFLTRAGIKTVLFMEPPTAEQLQRYDGLQAIGVAGLTRSMPPDVMEVALLSAFNKLKALGAAHVHYKVCSTFDSSPLIGSIGRAIEVGAKIFEAPFIPLLVAAPALGRYCFFGNLFARMGIGSTGQVYRLDRHPSMSKHPVTPAHESDLRLHLAEQTDKRIGLIDVLQLAQSFTQAQQTLKDRLAEGWDTILFDGGEEEHLTTVGHLIDEYASPEQPLFSVGSSGIEMALGNHWKTVNKIKPKIDFEPTGKVETLLVISGSCSPVTSRQIEVALEHNFVEIIINTEALASGKDSHSVISENIQQATAALQAGKSVVVHTGGNNPDCVDTALEAFIRQGLTPTEIRSKTAQLYGTALGSIADAVIAQTNVKRLLIAGGDTSSYAARALGIEAVEMTAPIVPGAPLCKAYAPGKPVDGLEVNIKGGQVGDEHYFLTVLKGQAN
jgi:uncharacterized protein YgbK (DUF1537 family)